MRRHVAWLPEVGFVISFAALFVTLSITSDVFLTWTNLANILDQWAPVGIMACAATLVVIAGGFDLSVGAIYAVAGITAAKIADATSPELGFLAGRPRRPGARPRQRPPRDGRPHQLLHRHARHRAS